MSTTGDAPLNLTLPQSADYIDLGVLNANYVAINTLASNHEDRLDDIEPTLVSVNNAVTSGVVYNSTRWSGRKLYVQSTAPTSGMVEGDVWLKVQ